jgi:hypothetical protein
MVEEDDLKPSDICVKEFETYIAVPDLKSWKQTNIVNENLNTLS